jgi:hypothetical protein
MFKYKIPTEQIPLIHVVHEDDEILYNSPDSEWYRTLKDFPDHNYLKLAADYYNCLNHFNKFHRNLDNISNNYDELKDQAKQRLLFERSTMNKTEPVLYEVPPIPEIEQIINSSMICPGIPPHRLGGGKKPKCFFALLKSFIGAPLMGFEAEPERIHDLLRSNPQFARVCGFFPKGQDNEYWYKNIPSLRKLQQFDQIMTEYGLWSRCKHFEIYQNIENGTISKENVLVGDTTHYHAYSSFETVTYINEKGKEKRKSQSKATKNCRCEDRENCPHEWQLADDGAGTIVKAHNKFIWGHKASILGLPLQGIPLDAIAVADASTHDGETFFPHVAKLFEDYPLFGQWIDTVLYDSACDSQALKNKFNDELGIVLKASLNPRRKKTVTDFLPKGMEKITPYGNLICKAGFEMEYKGTRYETERFIYGAPTSACHTCEHKAICCPNADNGRKVQIPFDTLPHIDPNDPPMAKRFKALMTRRPSIERIIKRLKCDFGSDRLTKRSNTSFQAYLDKTMIAFHILLRN